MVTNFLDKFSMQMQVAALGAFVVLASVVYRPWFVGLGFAILVYGIVAQLCQNLVSFIVDKVLGKGRDSLLWLIDFAVQITLLALFVLWVYKEVHLPISWSILWLKSF